MYKICLDPGHNEIGPDTGASFGSLLEQTLTLRIAGMVKEGLEYQGVFQVIMTRDGGKVNGPCATTLDSLRTRCRIANDANADLFVSVHINAGGGTGSEVLIIEKGGKAEQCANVIAPLIAEAGDWNNRGVKVQNVHVLRETSMPAILTENGFIDNDNEKLRQDCWLELIADAHVMGICSYFGVRYKAKVQNPVSANPLSPLPSLILYYGDTDGRIVPFLQEKIKAPSLPLKLVTSEVANAAKRVYGVGGSEESYVVNGKRIPLYKLYSGEKGIDTAEAVIKSIKAGNM